MFRPVLFGLIVATHASQAAIPSALSFMEEAIQASPVLAACHALPKERPDDGRRIRQLGRAAFEELETRLLNQGVRDPEQVGKQAQYQHRNRTEAAMADGDALVKTRPCSELVPDARKVFYHLRSLKSPS